MIQEENTRKV